MLSKGLLRHILNMRLLLSDNDDQDMETKEDEVNHSDDDESVHMETCACCGAEGELLCCETCPLVYHVDCAYPPLRRVPRGEWICQVCSGADRDLPTSRRIKKSIIRGVFVFVFVLKIIRVF